MPNYSGVWNLKEQGVAVKGGIWKEYVDLSIRAVFAGGFYEAYNIMDYVSISSTGNATDFGDLSSARGGCAGLASATRGVVGGGLTTGFSTSGSDFIDYITIGSTGNGTDFGNLSVSRNSLGACNSATRGIFFGGRTGTGATGTNTIDYITIGSTGDATDFGDATTGFWAVAGTSSSTRGVFGGDYDYQDYIDYITIASTGDATDFGNLSLGRHGMGAFSNGTRACFGGGTNTDTSLSVRGAQEIIDYITIASTGNATDFGDLTERRKMLTGVSSSTRGIFAGGYMGHPYNARVEHIDYITIASTGNATDFGDLTQARDELAGISNANGGLQ